MNLPVGENAFFKSFKINWAQIWEKISRVYILKNLALNNSWKLSLWFYDYYIPRKWIKFWCLCLKRKLTFYKLKMDVLFMGDIIFLWVCECIHRGDGDYIYIVRSSWRECFSVNYVLAVSNISWAKNTKRNHQNFDDFREVFKRNLQKKKKIDE